MTVYTGHYPGNIVIRPGDDVTALTSIGGDMLSYAAGVSFPALTSIGGYLSSDAAGVAFPALTSIGGNLSSCAEGVSFPALTSIGGDLSSYAEGASFPALTSIGGNLSSYAEGVSFPALKTIDGLPFATPEEAAPRIREIAEIVLANPKALNMERWHCGTTHCIAGWAEHIAAARGEVVPDGNRLTRKHGTHLLGIEAASHFHDSNAAALAWLKSKLDKTA